MTKYSKTLTQSTNTSDFIIPFSETLSPNKKYQIGLISFSTYNNIHNITKDNNLFRYTIDRDDRYYSLNPGAYELDEILTKIKNLGGGYFSKDKSGKLKMALGKNQQIDFTGGDSFHELLGFEKMLYIGSGDYLSENFPKIRSVHTINIECDIIKPYLYSFPVNTIPLRDKIDERMNPPRYLPITKKPSDGVHIRILDQDRKLIDFDGCKISIAIELREI